MENRTLWSYIDLSQGERPDFRKVLKRSQGALLDIVMPINGSPRDLEYRPNYLVEALEIVGPHAYRWRSLHVIDRRSNRDPPHLTLGVLISRHLENLKFPSLKYFTIQTAYEDMPYPAFLSQTRAPALEYLELEDYSKPETFSPATTLESLRLKLGFPDYIASPVAFFQLISTYNLTTLKLEGHIPDWLALQSNSVQFPVLSALYLDIDRTIQFLDAIIAPNLEHCDVALDYHLPLLMFSGLGSKFSSVQRLSIHSPLEPFTHRKYHVPHTYCEAFPGVRRVELDSNSFSRICAAFHRVWTHHKVHTLWISGKIWKPCI